MKAWICNGDHPGVDLPISVPKGEACSGCGAREPNAASGLRLPRCVWCGRPISGIRFKTCRSCYDLEQALRLYYNGGRHNGERV